MSLAGCPQVMARTRMTAETAALVVASMSVSVVKRPRLKPTDSKAASRDLARQSSDNVARYGAEYAPFTPQPPDEEELP